MRNLNMEADPLSLIRQKVLFPNLLLRFHSVPVAYSLGAKTLERETEVNYTALTKKRGGLGGLGTTSS